MSISKDLRLRKRFCKDRGLSINLFESPYFEQRLWQMDALDDFYDVCSFVNENYQGETDKERVGKYLDDCMAISEKVIEYVKGMPAYQAFLQDKTVLYLPMLEVGSKNLYTDANVGKQFISIDMNKANFSALVHYGKEKDLEFFPEYDYHAFLEKCISEPLAGHLSQSKYLRQVIFGNCSPKTQRHYESALMKQFYDALTTGEFWDRFGKYLKIYGSYSDEIVFEYDANAFSTEKEETHTLYEYAHSEKFKDALSILKKLQDFIQEWSKTSIPLKMETFRLTKVNDTQAYVKALLANNNSTIIDFVPKCVNPYDAPYVYRTIKDYKKLFSSIPKKECSYNFTEFEPTPEDDKVFIHEGRLAKEMKERNVFLIKNAAEIKLEKDAIHDKENEEEAER